MKVQTTIPANLDVLKNRKKKMRLLETMMLVCTLHRDYAFQLTSVKLNGKIHGVVKENIPIPTKNIILTELAQVLLLSINTAPSMASIKLN